MKHSRHADLFGGDFQMVRLGRIVVLTVMCCSLPVAAAPAFSATFELRHQTSYAYMPLPGTLGESITFEWGFESAWADVELFDLPIIGDPAEFSVYGVTHFGPLLSLDAEWNADGSIGDADYIYGKGDFVLELLFDLLDGTPHKMTIRGETGPLHVSVSGGSSNDITMSFLDAKVDRESAALLGMKRQVSGSTYYYTDVYDLDSPDRELALFGSMYFDYTPTHPKSADLTAVPEPGALTLIGLGVAAATLRRFVVR
jgi:hypothetical protein